MDCCSWSWTRSASSVVDSDAAECGALPVVQGSESLSLRPALLMCPPEHQLKAAQTTYNRACAHARQRAVPMYKSQSGSAGLASFSPDRAPTARPFSRLRAAESTCGGPLSPGLSLYPRADEVPPHVLAASCRRLLVCLAHARRDCCSAAVCGALPRLSAPAVGGSA